MDNPSRRSIAAYPLQSAMQLRFGDVDSQRHLNNVAQARLYEEGVMILHRAAIKERPASGNGVVFQWTIRYLAEGRYPAPLQLGIGVGRLGGTSYRIDMGLFEEDRCISLCDTIVVFQINGASVPLPDFYRSGLAPMAMSGG